MPNNLTQTDQRVVVGDGLAVGCADLGIIGFADDKMAIELSFNHAWYDFPLASTLFRQIHASLSRCDIYYQILDKSPRRRWSRVEWHTDSGWWQPTVRRGNDIDDVAGSITNLYGIGRERWTQLVEPFAERLGEKYVLREE